MLGGGEMKPGRAGGISTDMPEICMSDVCFSSNASRGFESGSPNFNASKLTSDICSFSAGVAVTAVHSL
jgi:hypothetical protein